MKIFFASFFLFIFSFQIIPVKEIGRILFKGAMAEEVHETEYESSDTPENEKLKKDTDPYSSPGDAFYRKEVIVDISTTYNTINHLPAKYIPDIPTPPPNLVA